MPAPYYALCQPEKLNGGQLFEIIAAMPPELVAPWENGLKRTVAEKRTFIAQAKADYWNSTPKSKVVSASLHSFGAKTQTTKTSLHTITGTECDAWLANLPATPLYGADD